LVRPEGAVLIVAEESDSQPRDALAASGARALYNRHLRANGHTGNAHGIDAFGNSYVTGQTASPDFPVTADAFDTSTDGGRAFLLKLSSDGSWVPYSTFLNGDDNSYGKAVALDPTRGAYIAGHTSSDGFPVTSGAFDTSYNGLSDCFIIRFAFGPPCARCDLNGDRAVGWLDIGPFSAAYGATTGDASYDTRYDFSGDGIINGLDLGIFSGCYGMSW